MEIISLKKWWRSELKGGPGSGNWEGPGDPRFEREGEKEEITIQSFSPGEISKIQLETIKQELETWVGDRKQVAQQAVGFLDIDYLITLSNDSGLKGVVSINLGSSKDQFVHISRLATAERGYGEAMMNKVFSFAKDMGKGISLMSLPEAEGFYRKLGMIESPKPREKGLFIFSADQIAKKSLSGELSKLEPEDGVFCNMIISKSLGLSTIFKGGPGSGSWEGPADPRFAFEGSEGTKIVDGVRVMSDGNPLPNHLANLRIPPAWTNVSISKDPNSGLLVKGQDSKGRSQSIYSEKFMKQHADAKFSRVLEMNRKFDSIQKENERNLSKSKDSEIKESAAALSVIMVTGIRPGSNQDTGAEKQAFGATTLEGRHVKIDGNKVKLEFVGKKGVELSIPVIDPKVATMLIDRSNKVGEGGKLFNVDHGKLLNYTKGLDGGGFNIKDFRTLLGTKTAIEKIKEYGDKKPSTMKEFKKMVKDVAITVSKKLGNTPIIALQSYINPTVFSKWQGAQYTKSVDSFFSKHLPGQHDQMSHGSRNSDNKLSLDRNIIPGREIKLAKVDSKKYNFSNNGTAKLEDKNLGKCFDTAGRFVLNNYSEGDLIHGIIKLGEIKIAHAWIELPGDIVFDGTQTQFFDKSDYYKVTNAVPEYKYTFDKAREFMLNEGYFGPWETTSGLLKNDIRRKSANEIIDERLSDGDVKLSEEELSLLQKLKKKIGLSVIFKHLSGQHDQSTHGRRGFHGKPINSEGKDTMEQFRNVDGSWTKERQKLHKQIKDKFFEGMSPVKNPVSYLMGGGGLHLVNQR